MSTIVTRSGKGSPLTNTEVDANFTNLNTDKIQSGDTVAALTITTASVSGDLTVDTSTLKVDSSNNRVGILDATPSVSLDAGSATDAMHVPSGTTAQRPTGAAGLFRYNSTSGEFEGYTSSWGSIGGGTANVTVNTFTGNGNTAFTLSSTPASINNTSVYIDGVHQAKSTYGVSGTTITFTTAPPTGSSIQVEVSAISVIGVPSDGTVTYAKMQDVSATDRVLGRDSAGSGVVEEIAPAALRTMLNVADGATKNLVLDTSVKTGNFTASAGNTYLCNTNGGAFTMTLPASPTAGDMIGIIDYNGTFDTNNLTLGQNGKNVFRANANGTIDTVNWASPIVFVDNTVGWLVGV